LISVLIVTYKVK